MFTKTWTFRNGGDQEWPDDTLFIQTNGDDFNASPLKIEGPVKPNQEIDVTLTMYAPQAPGNYIAFFRFVHGDNNRFGQKVWCDIMVVASSASHKSEPAHSPQLIKSGQEEPKEERSSLLNDSME